MSPSLVPPPLPDVLLGALLAALLAAAPGGGGDAVAGQEGAAEAARAELVRTLAAGGVKLDLERELLALPAEVLVRDELLEYLLVRRNGATHESLLLTDVDPSLLNAALLGLGATPGTNVVMTPVEPRPTIEEQRAGAPFFDLELPAGDGLLLYLAWRDGEETYFFRIEDLVANLATGRTMRRHRWVFLGSRFLTFEDGREVFAATQYGNLVNISFFQEGHTLLTAALEECIEQTIWAANFWLVPEREAPVLLIAARRPLAVLPPELAADLPDVAAWRRAAQEEAEEAEAAEPAPAPGGGE